MLKHSITPSLVIGIQECKTVANRTTLEAQLLEGGARGIAIYVRPGRGPAALNCGGAC
jgi:hypothetical protein